jgi:DNA-binding NarL/FixJ family response regulator
LVLTNPDKGVNASGSAEGRRSRICSPHFRFHQADGYMTMLTTTETNSSKSQSSSLRSEHGRAELGRRSKILIIDDHFLIREAFRNILLELNRDAIIIEASDSGQAIRLMSEQSDINTILLDLSLPDRDGFSVLNKLLEYHPAAVVVALSEQYDRETVLRALDHGAAGFIAKSEQRQAILNALQLVFAGGIHVPREIFLRENSSPSGPNSPQASTRPMSPADVGLTGRQLDVLELMMHGNSNKAICRALDLAEPTVKNHVTAILKALKVTNRTKAVIKVGSLGWQLSGGELAKSGSKGLLAAGCVA